MHLLRMTETKIETETEEIGIETEIVEETKVKRKEKVKFFEDGFEYI